MVTYQKNWIGFSWSAYTQRAEWSLHLTASLCTVIYREIVIIQKMLLEPKNTINSVIKVINYIKENALNSGLFKQLCDEMDAKHKRLLLHTKVRWLTKGRSLVRIWVMKACAETYSKKKNCDPNQIVKYSWHKWQTLHVLVSHYSQMDWLLRWETNNTDIQEQSIHKGEGRKKLSICSIGLMEHVLQMKWCLRS